MSSIQHLAKVAVLSSDWPNFSFRRLPSDPFPHVLRSLANMLYGGGRVPELSLPYLAKIAVLRADWPNFSFRQLPWTSMDFRFHMSCVI